MERRTRWAAGPGRSLRATGGKGADARPAGHRGPDVPPTGQRRRHANPPAGTRPAPGEAGFALLAALLALVGLTALATGGFLLSRTEYQINENHRASVRAFYIANSGMWDYLGRGRISTDTQTYAYPDGSAMVWATKMVDVDPMSTLYRITSRGRHVPRTGGRAERTVSLLAIHAGADIDVQAAILAAGGLRKNGVAGTVSGFDAASPGACPRGTPASLAGLMVPPGGFSMSGGGKKKGGGGPPGFYGDPPIDDTRVARELLESTGVDWQGILDGTFIQPDYVVSRDGYPNFGSQVAPDEWPVILIDYPDYSLNPTKSGRGTLAARGDLTLNGSFSWDGLILVGDNLRSNGNQEVHGAVITGLNLLLGEAIDGDDLGNGTWNYRYHSCAVRSALLALGAPAQEPGTWFEAM